MLFTYFGIEERLNRLSEIGSKSLNRIDNLRIRCQSNKS